MKRWILVAIVLAVASGCDQGNLPDSKVEAQKRWLAARGKVMSRVAENRLAAGELAAATEAAGQALALQPDSHEAKLLMAKIRIEQGKYSAATETLDQVVQARPQSSEAAYLLGVAQEKSGKLAEALASYRRAYGLDESNLAAVMAAAEVLVAMGDVRQAQLYVDSYLPKAGDNPGMFGLAGRLAMMNKEYGKAADHYQRARDSNSDNIAYLEVLGRAQYLAGRFADATDNLGELIGHKDYKAATWVYMMLGDSCMALGKPTEAFEAYFSASERSPASAAVWVSLAKGALAMNDPSRAALAAEKALKLEPGHADAALLLGYALLRKGRHAEAVRALTDASGRHPGNDMIQCLLGRAHAGAGNHAQAVRCYTAALRINPNSRVARELLSGAGGKQLSKVD